MALRHALRGAARCGAVASRSSALGDGVRCVAPRLSRGLAGAATRVLEVASDAEYAAALKAAPGLVVTDFTAKWCGPCKLMAPVFDALAAQHADVRFIKVDIDTEALADTVAAARVSAVPTFAFSRAGRPVYEIRGADAAGLREAVAKLKSDDAP